MNKRNRPKMLKGSTYQLKTGCGHVYITINRDEYGLFELFATMGKAGGCASSNCEAIGRVVSLSWRNGIEPQQIIKTLQGISCHLPTGFGDTKILSCADAIAQAIKENITTVDVKHSPPETIITPTLEIKEKKKEKTIHRRGACPECGGIMKHEAGCCSCTVCFYSDCG